jgi:hypothetical protein
MSISHFDLLAEVAAHSTSCKHLRHDMFQDRLFMHDERVYHRRLVGSSNGAGKKSGLSPQWVKHSRTVTLMVIRQ